MAQRRVVRSRTSSTRRTRAWARSYGSTGAITAAPGLARVFTQYESMMDGIVEEGTTIGAVKMTLSLQRTTGSTDTVPAIVGGLRVAGRSEDDVDILPGTLPGGVHQDWMWWHMLYLVGDGASPATTWRRSFDIEVGAQRRIMAPQQELVLAFERPFGLVDTYDVSWAVSVLLLLP